MLEAVLAGDVGQLIAEVSVACEDGAHFRLLVALAAFENEHVVELAPRPLDARDHGDQEHAANSLGVGVLLRAEIGREPRIDAPRPVPGVGEAVELIADWVIGALARPLVDRLVNDLAPDAW